MLSADDIDALLPQTQCTRCGYSGCRPYAEAIEPRLPISIGLVDDPSEECSGPLWLRGGIPVVSADGTPYEVRNRQTLCRCGGSANKPFCDGTHITIKFKA
jgi:hypothetical protein